jgi:hypothetical protein
MQCIPHYAHGIAYFHQVLSNSDQKGRRSEKTLPFTLHGKGLEKSKQIY